MPISPACGRLAGLFLLAVALAGCGEEGSAGSRAARTKMVASEPQRPIPVPSAIAIREGRIRGEPVTLELTQLRRRGRVVNLELRLRAKQEEVDVGGAFEDDVTQNLTDPSDDWGFESDAIDGISLIDGVNGRRFAPARDRYNHCICDRELGSVTVSPDRPLTLSATFGAPPANVKAVDVVIPLFGTIADVPLG